ncbi:MAG: DUF3313 domain-containing protein [Desulfobulbaceae bacterium]|nr:DUF3313 domain-containing protein [Desulfobulbaceae bacterium]
MTRKTSLQIVCLIMVVLIAGCAAQKIETKETSGFLKDYSDFSKGSKEQLGMIYEKPGLDLSTYKKVMIDHVVIYLNPSSAAQAIQPEQLTELSRYFHQSLIKALESRYKITDQPGSDVLRVRTAITDVEPGHPVGGSISSVLPIGIAISSATKAVSDTNIGVGRAAMEIELVSSTTGERLAAAVDRREGGKQFGSGKWADIEKSFDHWAEKLGAFLDKNSAK